MEERDPDLSRIPSLNMRILNVTYRKSHGLCGGYIRHQLCFILEPNLFDTICLIVGWHNSTML